MNVIQNKELSGLYTTNLRTLGQDLSISTDGGSEVPLGSTDMGNVSYIVPSIHPFYNIGTNALNHTHDFTTAAGNYCDCNTQVTMAVLFTVPRR